MREKGVVALLLPFKNLLWIETGTYQPISYQGHLLLLTTDKTTLLFTNRSGVEVGRVTIILPYRLSNLNCYYKKKHICNYSYVYLKKLTDEQEIKNI